MPKSERDCCLCLSTRDIATILFALRYFQANVDDASGILRDSEHFVDEKPIVGRELDYLCQHINTSSVDLDGQELDIVMRISHTVLDLLGADPMTSVTSVVGQIDNLDAQAIVELYSTLSNHFERPQP